MVLVCTSTGQAAICTKLTECVAALPRRKRAPLFAGRLLPLPIRLSSRNNSIWTVQPRTSKALLALSNDGVVNNVGPGKNAVNDGPQDRLVYAPGNGNGERRAKTNAGSNRGVPDSTYDSCFHLITSFADSESLLVDFHSIYLLIALRQLHSTKRAFANVVIQVIYREPAFLLPGIDR